MNPTIFRTFSLITVFCCSLYSQHDTASVTWIFDRLDPIGGVVPAKLNGLPVIVETPYGMAAQFDGIDDGLLFNSNPLAGATAFTIEIFFRPDSNELTGDKNQPRFLHLRPIANNDRRITMETRILNNQRWAFDSFIRSEVSNLAQLDSSQTHSSGEWHHAAMTYQDSVMKQFVDGKEQLSGSVVYLPMDASARVSIGVRQDPRYWFKGAIRMIKFSKHALLPSEFTLPVMTGIQKSRGSSSQSGFLQNYPNPCNPGTTIRFYFLKKEFARIDLFDMLGRQIATLFRGIFAEGAHTIPWNGTDENGLLLPSGVYLCRIQTESFLLTQKMVLVR